MTPERRRDPAELNRIGEMMRARVGDLVQGVWGLRKGFREGNDWVTLNPLRADRTANSFRVSLAGPYRGMVKDFAGPFGHAGKETMSALSFHAELMHGGDMGAAVRWAKDWLGLSGHDPARLQRTNQALEAWRNRDDVNPEEVEKRRRKAKAIYLEGKPLWTLPADQPSPGWLYLRDRGIDLARLPWMQSNLRFHPALYNSELKRELPGIVMAINGLDGTFFGVHRIWIDQDRQGRWVKYPGLLKAKKAFGPYTGGTIRIWNGRRVLTRTGEVVYGLDFGKAEGPLRLHLTEGPEDALAVAIALPDERVMAAVSVSNMGAIAFPEKVNEVVLWKQADPPDSAGDRKFWKNAANFHAQGKIVRVADVARLAPVKDPAEAYLKGAG